MWDLMPYYLFFSFMFMLYGNMRNRTSIELSTKTSKVTYLYWVMIALWILIGMRDVLYGRDTLGYVMDFKGVNGFDFTKSAEPGYTLLIYIMHAITDNYHIYLMVASLSTVVAMYKIMKRYFSDSYEIIAAICVYTLLGMLAFNMAALRQTIAVSCGIFAFMYASDGKWKHFLACVAIAYTFHNSSFVLLVLYPLRYFDAKRYGLIGVATLFAIGVVAPSAVVPFFQTYLPMEDRFSQYGTIYESSQNYTGFLLQLILVIIAYFRRDYIQLETKTKNLFFNCAYIGLGVQSLTVSLAELYRVSFYFCIFNIILIPIALMTYKGGDARSLRLFFILGALFYIFVLSGGGVLPLKQDYVINNL